MTYDLLTEVKNQLTVDPRLQVAIEYPPCISVEFVTVDGNNVITWFGTANDCWEADVYLNPRHLEVGLIDETLATDVPSGSTSAARIAYAIADALAKRFAIRTNISPWTEH
jgi:hypothetical protein